MALARRYQPSLPPGESAYLGMDFSPILPPGVILESASVTILTNTNPATPGGGGWTLQPPVILGRQAWVQATGGTEGVDYQIRFSAQDSRGNTWNRTALLLCAQSS